MRAGGMTQDANIIPDAEHFIGASPAMHEIYKAIASLLGHEMTVTITGETGTGKALLARTLHYLSKRRNAPFIEAHITAIPTQLMEDVLFGVDGKLAQAAGGTLFLDDIDALPTAMQTRLLHLLQQGEYCPPGADVMVKADVRFVCATRLDVMLLVRQGEFLEELYYRLNVIPLRLPPLRDRRDDIAPLANYFLRKASEKGLPPRILDAETIEAMETYDWPGNVRELENMMMRFCIFCPESIVSKASFLNEINLEAPKPSDRPQATLEQNVQAHLQHYFHAHSEGRLPPPGLYDRILPLVEKPLIEMTMRATGGNQVKAAFVLGINRNTLRKKIAALHVKTEVRA